jgi:uncharacterized protein YegL
MDPEVVIVTDGEPAAEAQADAAVEIAKIEAEADVAIAAIGAEVAVAAIEADAEQEDEEFQWLQSEFAGLTARLDGLSADLRAHRQSVEPLLTLLTAEAMAALISLIPATPSADPIPTAQTMEPESPSSAVADGPRESQEGPAEEPVPPRVPRFRRL